MSPLDSPVESSANGSSLLSLKQKRTTRHESEGIKLFSGGKRSTFALLLLAVCAAAACAPGMAAAAGRAMAASLQALIDQARPGDTVTIPAGVYTGPIRVTKPLVLEAEGEVRLIGTGEEAVLTLRCDGATVRGLSIVDERINPPAALVVEGSGNVLEQIEISTLGTGVRLLNASGNKLTNIRVLGLIQEHAGGSQEAGGHDHAAGSSAAASAHAPLQKGNGIELFHSDQNRIMANQIVNVLDGVYLENSDANHIENNQVERSRYGYHLMGTAATTLMANTGSENVTGAMVMTTSGAVVKHNRFLKQRENPYSQGILLFDVTDSAVENNQVEGNRVGIFVEESSGNRLAGNRLLRNFIGMQIKESADNVVSANLFVSNVIQAQAQDSTANRFIGNYWDDLQGLDLDGDGRSELPYELNPFFLALTAAVPPYQLFFQAPGYVFLEGLFASGPHSSVRDEAPLLAPPASQADAAAAGPQTGLALLSVLLLTGSCLFIYRGVRRS